MATPSPKSATSPASPTSGLGADNEAAALSKAEEKKVAGTARYTAGAFDEAASLYAQAIGLLPSSAAAATRASYLNNRSAARLMLKQAAEALEDALAAISIDPSFAKAYPRASKCYLSLGQFSQARAILEQSPTKSAHTSELSEIAKYEKMQQRVNDMMAEAAQAESSEAETTPKQKSNYSLSLSFLHALLTHTPNNFRAHCQQIECMLRLKQFDNVKPIIDTLYRNHSSNVDIIYLRGLYFYLTGNSDLALKHCQEILRNDPDHRMGAKLFKLIRLVNKEKEEGNALFSAGKTDEAIAKYSQCLSLDRENQSFIATILANRAAAYIKQKQWDRAIEDCDASLAINGNNAKVLLRRSQCRRELNQWEECVRDIEAAIKLGSTDDLQRQLRDAKLELKKSKRKDYYKVLGLDKNTFSEAELKKAYRRAAMQWHPDKNNSSEEQRLLAEGKFKEITEANEVLSDDTKRRRYDSGVDLEDLDGPGGGHSHGGFGGGGIDPSDLFGMFFGQGGGMGGMGGFGGMRGGSPHGHGHGRYR